MVTVVIAKVFTSKAGNRCLSVIDDNGIDVVRHTVLLSDSNTNEYAEGQEIQVREKALF